MRDATFGRTHVTTFVRRTLRVSHRIVVTFCVGLLGSRAKCSEALAFHVISSPHECGACTRNASGAEFLDAPPNGDIQCNIFSESVVPPLLSLLGQAIIATLIAFLLAFISHLSAPYARPLASICSTRARPSSLSIARVSGRPSSSLWWALR